MCLTMALAETSNVGHVTIPLVVESLQYLSSERTVIITFDVVISNGGSRPTKLFLSHPDNVHGYWATQDWRFNSVVDTNFATWPHIESVRLAYGDAGLEIVGNVLDIVHRGDLIRANIDVDESIGRATKRCDSSSAQPRSRIPAPWCTPGEKTLAGIDVDHGPENKDSQFVPTSSFISRAIHPAETALCRLTVIVSGDAYARLVESPREFSLLSGSRIRSNVRNFGLDRLRRNSPKSVYEGYLNFFSDVIEDNVVIPDAYRLIVQKPRDQRDMDIRFIPASSNVGESFIVDAAARDRITVFDTWSDDFLISMSFERSGIRPKYARMVGVC